MSAIAEVATAPSASAVTNSQTSSTSSKQIATKFSNSGGGKQVQASAAAAATTPTPVVETAANQTQQANRQAGGAATTNLTAPNSSTPASSISATANATTMATTATVGAKSASRNCSSNNSNNNGAHNTSTTVPMGKFKAKRPEPLKLNPNLNQEIPLDLSVKSAGNAPSGGTASIFNLAVAAVAIGQSNTTLETPRIVWQDNESLLKQRLFSGSGSVSTPSSGQQRARLSSAAADSPPITPYLELLCSPALGGGGSQQSPQSTRTGSGGQQRRQQALALAPEPEVSPNSMATASRSAQSGSATCSHLRLTTNGEPSCKQQHQQQLLLHCNNASGGGGLLRTPRRSCSTENLSALASFNQAHPRVSSVFKQQQYQACEGGRRTPPSNRFLYSGQQVVATIYGGGCGSGTSNASSASSGAGGHQPQSPTTSAATMAAAAFVAATAGSESQSSDTLGGVQQALTPASVANATANLLNIHLNSPTALAAAAAAHLGSLGDQLDPLISAAYCQQQQRNHSSSLTSAGSSAGDDNGNGCGLSGSGGDKHSLTPSFLHHRTSHLHQQHNHNQGGSGSDTCSTTNGFPSLGSSCSATLNTPTLISPSQLKGGSGCFLPSPTLSPLSSVFELPSPLLVLPTSSPTTTPTLATATNSSRTPPSSAAVGQQESSSASSSSSPSARQQSVAATAAAVADAVTTAANRFVQQQLLQSPTTTARAPSEPTLASSGEQRGIQLHLLQLQQLPPAAPPSSKASSELALNCTAQLARPASLAHLVTAARDKVGRLMDDDDDDDDDHDGVGGSDGGLDLDGHGALADDGDDDGDPEKEVAMDIEQQGELAEQEKFLLGCASHDKQAIDAHFNLENNHHQQQHHSSHSNISTGNSNHHHSQQQSKQLAGNQPRAASGLVPRILVSDCLQHQQLQHSNRQQGLVTQRQDLGWPASEQGPLSSQLTTNNEQRHQQEQLDALEQQARASQRELAGKRALSQQSFRARVSLYHNERLESSSAPPDVYQGRARSKLKSASNANSCASLGLELGGASVTGAGSSAANSQLSGQHHHRHQQHQQQMSPQQQPDGHHYKAGAPYPEARWLAGSPQEAYLSGNVVSGARSAAGLAGVRPSSAEPRATGQLARGPYQQPQQQHQLHHQQQHQSQQQPWTGQIQQPQHQSHLNLSQQFSVAAAAVPASPYNNSQSVQHLQAVAAAASGGVSSGDSQQLASAAEQFRQQQQQQSLGGQFSCQSGSAGELNRSSAATLAASNNPFSIATHNHHHNNSNHHHHAAAATAAAAALGRQLINPPPQSGGKSSLAESRHHPHEHRDQQPAAPCAIGSGFRSIFQEQHQHQLMGVAQQHHQHHHQHHHQPRALSADGRGVGLGRVESPCSMLLPEFGFRSSSAASSGAQKKYQCDQCAKSFTRSDMLTRHKRLHSGDRPFQCNECKQEFSRSDHLSTHMRTHTGEKPYKCKLCSYSACRKDMITRHMKVHNRSSPNAPFEPTAAAR